MKFRANLGSRGARVCKARNTRPTFRRPNDRSLGQDLNLHYVRDRECRLCPLGRAAMEPNTGKLPREFDKREFISDALNTELLFRKRPEFNRRPSDPVDCRLEALGRGKLCLKKMSVAQVRQAMCVCGFEPLTRRLDQIVSLSGWGASDVLNSTLIELLRQESLA